MSYLWEALGWVPIAMLPFNWTWDIATERMRRALPGSLQEAHYRRKCRMLRWPGAMCWPIYFAYNAWQLAGWPGFGAAFAYSVFLLLTFFWSRRDLRELRRQIEEDEDDW